MTNVFIKDSQGEEEKFLGRQAKIRVMKEQTKERLTSAEDGRGQSMFSLRVVGDSTALPIP